MAHAPRETTTAKPAWQTLLLAGVLATSAVGLTYLFAFYQPGPVARAADGDSLSLKDIPFDGARAYEYLKALCALGPRPSGSAAMKKQQELLLAHFQKLGGQASLQKFQAPNPMTGERVPMANLVVEWHPERRERILLCAHYDTRPFPDQDPRNPRGRFVGANDGASGTAVLMEMAHGMAELPGTLGVDFVLFDGEEFVFHDDHPYFLGSEYFATEYVRQRRDGHRYRYGVLLDMVGDADLQIFQERNSVSWNDSRPLVAAIWDTARKLGVKEFVARPKFEIRDDHLKLHQIGQIPSCDIIDFDYPYWHTEADNPSRCSALSLAKVGWVVREWLKGAVE